MNFKSTMAWLHVMCLFAFLLIAEDARQCDPGHYGESCELLCSPHCAVEPGSGGTVGDCDRVTGKCYEGCVRGWYQDDCSRPCSQTCKDNICNRDNGHCTLRCSEPHVGDFCTEVLNTDGSRECLKGRYGSDCLLPCPAQCWSNPLDPGRTAGRCDGDTGVCGDGCHRGWYGDHCNQTCSRNCKDNICSQGNGHCTLGCTGKYPGDVCTEVADQVNNNSLTPIISLVIFVVLLLVLVLVLVLRPRLLHYSRQKFCMAATEDTNPLLSKHEVDTDLIAACKEGKLDGVTDILDQSLEDINMKGHGGMTPVMWAARRGHREVLDLLVRKDANLKLVDDASNNLLHWACYGCNFAMVKFVLSLGKVDINNKGLDGRTPAMFVARQGYMKLFQLLVSKGDFPSEVDKDGNNILLLACWGGNEEIVKYILSYDDVDINGRGQSGRTPLMAAAYKGHGKVFDLLVDKEGADLTLVDDAGDNILHVACLGGHVDIVRRVLELGKVDKNSQGQYSRTPLMIAEMWGDKEMTDVFVSDGEPIPNVECEGGSVTDIKLNRKSYNPAIRSDNISIYVGGL